MGVAKPSWREEDLAFSSSSSSATDAANSRTAPRRPSLQTQQQQWTATSASAGRGGSSSSSSRVAAAAAPAESEVSCNVVLVGDAGVGKSALVSRVVFDKFVEVRKLIVIIDVLCFCCFCFLLVRPHAI